MSRPIRILVVEDNPGDAELIRDSLQEASAQLEIMVAPDGAQAIDYLVHRRVDDQAPLPDFVLLDLNLPKISGHEVIREARKCRALQTLPIIVLTSSEATRDITTSYALGANCYVTKPGQLVAFQSTMKAIADFWCSIVRWP